MEYKGVSLVSWKAGFELGAHMRVPIPNDLGHRDGIQLKSTQAFDWIQGAYFESLSGLMKAAPLAMGVCL